MQNGNNATQNATQEVTLKINIDEANLILEGLGLISFARVYTLVNKVQSQASAQLNGAENSAAPNQGVPIVKTDTDTALSKSK